LELVVCAAPFLRESDLRLAELGEDDDQRHDKILLGLTEHYQSLHERAQLLAVENGPRVPIIGTGHLFLRGALSANDDGVREIHAGPLSALPLEALPKFDYLALGHLHSPQIVGKNPAVRYSGSPIPMGFKEAGRAKSVCLIEFQGLEPDIQTLEVPTCQPLKSLSGDLDWLLAQIKTLVGSGAWLEVNHTGPNLAGDLRRSLDEAIANTDLEILTVKDLSRQNLIMSEVGDSISLNELSPSEIFERLLKDSKVAPEDYQALKQAHDELVNELESQDLLAE
jgi:exonuclease SbcD